MTARLIRLRYDGTCTGCGAALAAGERGWWDGATKQVHCASCEPDPAATLDDRQREVAAIDVGVAGASARAKHERLKARYERTVMTRHPRLGRIKLAMSDEPQSTKAWAQGALGEERVGRQLDSLASAGAVVLHDRRVPRSGANIDHIVVAPSSV